MAKLSVYIISYNQKDKIRECIESVLWVDEIIVADQFSTDGSDKIAESLGAKVVQIPFEGFGNTRNKALTYCQYEWILNLDTDERCTPEARQEIENVVAANKTEHDLYFVPRINHVFGKAVRYCLPCPDYRHPMLFRNGKMTYTTDVVHEGYISHSDKAIAYLKKYMIHMPFNNLSEMIDKMQRYSSLGAEKLAAKKKKTSYSIAFMHGSWAFIRHYFVKLGFLDGWAGFLIALGNFEGTFYRYAKYHQQQLKL